MARNASFDFPPPRLSALAALQKKDGVLSKDTVAALAREMDVPAHELYGLASFFPQFRLAPTDGPEIQICQDLSCRLAGSGKLLEAAQKKSGHVRVAGCACLGRCDRAPAAAAGAKVYTGAAAERLVAIAGLPKRGKRPPASSAPKIEAASRLFPYRRKGEAFLVLKALLREGKPEEAIAALTESGLRGMGGAGFPAGRKWEMVRRAKGPHKFLICNADESEPGTFKDRALMDSFPELIVEGILIGAWAVGAAAALIYIRHEYGRQRLALQRAIRAARARGLMGAGKLPEVQIFVSPGGYICGEETALLEVLEDRRAQPRDKPPFPVEAGLFGRPTLINNVETFALVPAILRKGAAWYRGFGRSGAAGIKMAGISGAVARPGVYEVELGTPVSELIEKTAGGMKERSRLKAFCPGGASSGFLPAALAGTPYDFDALAAAGSMLGSGALIAIPEGADMVALAWSALRFFRDESCGKCVPCRMGTEQIAGFLKRALEGRAARSELAELEDVSAAMMDTSICGLGQAAPLPFLSLLRHFRDELTAKLKG